MDGTSPVARALICLEALQDSPGASAERLAMRLGVTERAVRRYVRLLREAGIPIESTPGRYGGYRLGRGLRLPPLMLSATEALALVMAVLEGRPTPSDSADPVSGAIGKITRVLPASLAESITALRKVATSGTPYAAPDPDITAALVRASEARRRVRITYQLRVARMMDVDPWAVSVWRGKWYLLCWSHTVDARRVFRIDRVREVSLLEPIFVAPDDLDPIRAIEEHLSTGWRYEVEVVINAPVESVSCWLPANLGRLSALSGGRTRLRGSTDELIWYAHHLTAIEAPYRIVAPRELRAAAREVGRRLVRAGTVR